MLPQGLCDSLQEYSPLRNTVPCNTGHSKPNAVTFIVVSARKILKTVLKSKVQNLKYMISTPIKEILHLPNSSIYNTIRM